MEGLGRINLIVGANNCGKSSVLEAIHLLLRVRDPLTLWNVLKRRGEVLHVALRPDRPEMDPGHLFEGHLLAVGSRFCVEAANETYSRAFNAEVVATQSVLHELVPDETIAGLGLALSWNDAKALTF